ncbi:MAG: response regulator transcription factor [Acidimicrobiia bacterium]|nr:response regulator transcription factor [Acidimicrobiia bacterium]
MAAERLAGELVRVVVADDDDETRTVLVQLLNGADQVEVVGVAADVETAAGLISRQDPDVVLLDRVMPGVKGASTINELRRYAPNVAIVVLSGYGRDDPEAMTVASVADGYVEKGSPRATLLRAVRRAARREATQAGREATRSPCGAPSLQKVADALHDSPVQSLSGSLWILDALEGERDENRRRDLVRQLRKQLEVSLSSTRQVMRWARQGEGDADPAR